MEKHIQNDFGLRQDFASVVFQIGSPMLDICGVEADGIQIVVLGDVDSPFVMPGL